MVNRSIPQLLFPAFFLLGIVLIGYVFERHQSEFILPIYFVSFISYWYLVSRKEIFSIEMLLILGLIARVLLLPSTPSLSDDVYRFIWDGRLLAAGINPFAHIPSFYIENSVHGIPNLTNELYQLLNSPGNHTIYPPVVQFVFWMAALFFGDSIYQSIVFIRIFHFLADIGAMYFVFKLLRLYKLPPRNALLYFINPLVVLELTGNIHAEGIMLLFLFGGMYFYKKGNMPISGLFWALAVATKLIPLLFLPFLLFTTPIKQSIRLFGTFGIATLLLFLPLLDAAFITGMQSSVALYFQRFEFNASIYYVVREIGYWVKGYNIIATAGQVLALCSFVSIMAISIIAAFKKWNKEAVNVLLLFTYLLFTNILHPWYVIGLVGLSVFTRFQYGYVWSGVVFATYLGYTSTGFQENLWVVMLEYGMVIGMFIYEMKKKHPLKPIMF